MASKQDECVKVVVRIRPLSDDEERNGHRVCTEAFSDRGLITVKSPDSDDSDQAKNFFFDAVFQPNCTQRDIYDTCAASVVESVLNGYNGTIFAYGQTGSGKTHTMEGKQDPPHLRGVIPNSFQHIFDSVAVADKSLQFLVRASYLEIYNEEIRDLLSKDPKNRLELKENIETGVYVKDLTFFVVKNVTEIDHVMQAGKKNRSVGATLMNATSSRSHSIFTIIVECAENDERRGSHIRVGQLNLVDLAGSERQDKTGATGTRLKEATKINLSLSALGNVISALVDGKSAHVPYRDSKLTRLLQNSLGGNAKTVMCANAGPADYNYDETISTLRYANRAKNIKNKPKINEDPKDAMLREYQEEIANLKRQLAASSTGGGNVVYDEATGKMVAEKNVRTEVVEKVVEKRVEVLKEIHTGITEDEVKRKVEEERKQVMDQAASDIRSLIEQQNITEQEKDELRKRLEKEADEKRNIAGKQKSLEKQLKEMETKLIKGGEVISKAAQQEAELRKAELELREKKMLEARLAQELASKEEANLQLEEHFSSLQEEVEVKTRKLKKLYSKYQAAVKEQEDLQMEFQAEKVDMLETIRQLTRTIKLKDIIMNNFMPEECIRNVENRAKWSDVDDCWNIPKLESAGRNMKMLRPITNTQLKRSETEYARQRKQFDSNPRFRYDNIINLDIDMPEKTTQDFEGPGMVSKVDNILGMNFHAADDSEDINLGPEASGLTNPYLQYPGNNNDNENTESKPKASKKKSSSGGSSNTSSRPKSAARRSNREDK
eukprot:TRINITY_DN67869_c6_g4_i1.p1 TRINITY_DN67869_c6_g4~~TRINITY_DN67869_c6_g4_i1.p1  ORF type:complete len:778 (-),score=48.57 TRINITY_DN67869_c6_g4_i1:607-2940(-)